MFKENKTPIVNDKAINDNDNHSGNGKWRIKISLMPTKDKMATKLYFKYSNLLSIFARKKYMERNPKIAKILELKTKKGSEVIAKIAGTLSKANKISVNSIIIKAINKGGCSSNVTYFHKKLLPLHMGGYRYNFS